jgi:hypothetical protein
MSEPILILIENAIETVWTYLERAGELGDAAVVSRMLL